MTTSPPPGASAGSRRFWITVLVFALANLGAWLAYCHYAAPRRDLLRVEHFLPGDRSTVGPRPELAWRFNLDVRPDPKQPPGKVSPAIAGQWSWRDSRTLLFVPNESLPRATRLTFTLLPEHLRTAEGFVMAKAFTASVNTPALRVESIHQAGFEPDGRYVLQIELNDRVLAADLVSHLKLGGPDHRPLKFKLHGDGNEQVMRVMTDPVLAGRGREETLKIHAQIAGGLCGIGGPLAMESAYEQDVILSRILAITSAEGQSPARGEPTITLSTSGEIDVETARELIRVEPATKYTVSGDRYALHLRGDFKPGSRYAVRILPAPPGTPREKAPRPDTLSLLMPQREAGVWFENDQGYLGSSGNRTLMAHAVNLPELKLSIWRVYENNLVNWRNSTGNDQWKDGGTGVSEPLMTKTIALKGPKDQAQDLRISLDDLLPSGVGGDGVYRISLRGPAEERGRRHRGDEDEESGYELASAVATLSDIGLTAKQSPDAITVWAVSLSTAKPMADVRVRAWSSKNQLLGEGRTDGSGLATIRGVHPNKGEHAALIVAERSSTSATRPWASALTWLDLQSNEWGLSDTDVSGRPYLRSGYEAFIYADRGVYRPGETVYLRAIVRDGEQGTPKPMPVRWQVRRPDLRNWRSQTMMSDGDGACGWAIKLPDDLPTGRWSAQVGLPGAKEFFGSATFLVEEFVPERMKVVASIGDDKASLMGGERRISAARDALDVHVQADYLFGRPCAGLETSISARLDRAVFAPKQWGGWTFGDSGKTLDVLAHSSVGAVEADPAEEGDDDDDARGVRAKPMRASGDVELDAAGHGRWVLKLDELLPSDEDQSDKSNAFHGPWQLSVSASVHEVGGRAVTAGDSAKLDALRWYIGIHPPTAGALRSSVAATWHIGLVDPAGKSLDVSTRLIVQLYRETWNSNIIYRNGKYHYQSQRKLEPVRLAGLDKVKIDAGKGELTMTPPAGGAYVIRFSDPATGAMTSIGFYASDGSAWEDNISRENPERLVVTILPATRPTTRPANAEMAKLGVGQSAVALVRSPFPGRLLLSVETDQVMRTQVLEMAGSSVEVPLTVLEAWRPNAYVTATVIRPIDPNAKWRTHRAFGAARLCVDPSDRRMDIQIVAPAELRPRETLDVKLRITDANGAAIPNAAVTVAAVDEGILQLTRFQTPDPLGFFHASRALGVNSADLYSALMPEVPRTPGVSAVGGDEEVGRHRTPVPARRIKPVSLVSEVLHTDSDGVATAHFYVPQFAGKLRVMAVTSSGNRFGSAESAVLVRSPLLVQSSLPRFAAPGDRFTAPFLIFNNSPSAGEVQVWVQLLGDNSPLAFDGSPGITWSAVPVHLAAGGQAKIQAQLLARQAAGVAHLRITAAMGNESFEENIELPVRPAAPTITRGGFAAVTPAAPFKLEIPADLLPGAEQIQIRVTPWPTLQLPEGLDYLERYPHGCAEQTISSCFPLIYLSDIGPRIAPGVFEKERIAEKLQLGIIRLIGMQTADGGLAMWPGQREAWPWASVYAAHMLIEAQKAGHAVPEDFKTRLLEYVRHSINTIGDGDTLEMQSYACYVLALAGKPERAAMARLTELAKSEGPGALKENAPIRAQARLYLSLAWLASGRRDFAGDLIPQSIPSFRKERQSGGNIASPIRDRAMLVNALLSVRPDHPDLPHLVQQLADAGRKGEWRSTQECAFAVMAMGKYLRQATTHESYDGAQLLSGTNVLATSDRAKPLVWSTTRPAKGLVIKVGGKENASGYLSWIAIGVPLSPPPDADHGLKIRRRYLNENGEALAGNTINSGDLAIVELTVQGTPGQENIVVEDLLPAGLEIENPRLARAKEGDDAEDALPDRLDIRDDRLIVVAQLPGSGEWTYRYAARAVTPGKFTLPPIRGECMYDIGVNSISGSGGFTVLPADSGPTFKPKPKPKLVETPRQPVARAKRRSSSGPPFVY